MWQIQASEVNFLPEGGTKNSHEHGGKVELSNCCLVPVHEVGVNLRCFLLSESAIIGFNHGVLGLAENPALGPGFFRQNTSGYALGVLTPKASPLGWVFSQAQHPMIKTYNKITLCIIMSKLNYYYKVWLYLPFIQPLTQPLSSMQFQKITPEFSL